MSKKALDSPIAGYRIETLQWSIQMGPGHFEVLNGTIQEVMAQAQEINPNFEIPAVPEAEEKRSVSLAPSSSSRLNKRAHEICGIFPSASKFRIQEGISYLNRLPAGDRPLLPPGPGACGRVSCSYNSAIWWCNDVSSFFLFLFYHYRGDFQWKQLHKEMLITSTNPWKNYHSCRTEVFGDPVAGSSLRRAHKRSSTRAPGTRTGFRARLSMIGTGTPSSVVTRASWGQAHKGWFIDDSQGAKFWVICGSDGRSGDWVGSELKVVHFA